MMRPLIFGEVLFDHFPDGHAVLGGAPFNVAWHLHAFGLRPLFVSRVGNDAQGEAVRWAMREWGMEDGWLQVDREHPTGRVEVSFNDGEPAYDIVDRAAYDFIDAGRLPALDDGWLLYHGTLALRHADSAAALARLRQAHAGPVVVDINLRPPWWQRQATLDLVKGADWLKLNEDELAEMLPGCQGREEAVAELATLVREQIVLTGGERGAEAISVADGSRLSVAPEPADTVADTVGAGDAFCSVLIAGRLLGWPLAVTMERAQRFASAMVGVRGAICTERNFYRRFLDAWQLQG